MLSLQIYFRFLICDNDTQCLKTLEYQDTVNAIIIIVLTCHHDLLDYRTYDNLNSWVIVVTSPFQIGKGGHVQNTTNLKIRKQSTNTFKYLII